MNLKDFAYKNIKRNLKAYYGYFLSVFISSSLFFSFTMFLFHPDKGTFKSYINQVIFVTEVIAYIFLFFFVFYSMSVFLKSRFKEFGILYILGASKKQLTRIIFAENIIINTGATLSGIVAGLLFSKIYLVIIEKLFRLPFLRFYIPTGAILITLLSFILLGIIVAIFTSNIIKKKEVLKLLKATKAPKPAPKSSLLLAILGVLILTSSYYLSLTTTKTNLDKRILPVVALAIIATYLIFSQFSVYALKVMKKHKDFYQKNTKLLLISNLYYKLKDNGRMFFLIAITSAVAFTAIGTTYTFYRNTLGSIEKRYPYAFQYSTFGEGALVEEELAFLEAALSSEDYDYKKSVIEIGTYASSEDEYIQFISESTYNSLADQLKLSPKLIESSEALLIPSSEIEGSKKLLDISGEALSVTEIVREDIIPNVYDNTYVIDDDLFEKATADSDTAFIYTYQVDSWSDSYKVYDLYEEAYGDDDYSLLISKAHVYETEKTGYGVLMFLSIFLGIIFFVASASFIYNKFYMEEEADKAKYLQLNKIGLTYKEIKKVVTLEIGVLFMLPYIMAVIHSSFALATLRNLFLMEVTFSAFMVMGAFLAVQILYFLLIRSKYLGEIRDVLLD